jgi:hypothetical protein
MDTQQIRQTLLAAMRNACQRLNLQEQYVQEPSKVVDAAMIDPTIVALLEDKATAALLMRVALADIADEFVRWQQWEVFAYRLASAHKDDQQK